MPVTKPKPLKPHKWNKKRDAQLCIACEKPFVKGDSVYTHVAVNLHVTCTSLYRKQLVELGLL